MVASIIGKIAGGAAKGSADQRGAENQQALQKNSLLANLYGTNQNATMQSLIAGANEKQNQAQTDLQQRQFALAAPGKRASDAARGSLLQNVRSASFSGLPSRVSSSIPTLSGGLNPDQVFSPEARQAGAQLTRQSVMDLLKGDSFAPQTATDFKSGVLPLPQLEELKKSGLLEKILGGAGLVGSLIGSIGQMRGGTPSSGNGLPIDPFGGG